MTDKEMEKWIVAGHIVCAFILTSCNGHARADTAVGVHVGTYHFDRKANFNEFNPGVFVRVDRWQAGLYHNSVRKPSVYLSYAFPLTEHVALHLGAVTGYQAAPVMPAVMLSYSFDGGARLFGFPSTPKNSGGVHLAFERAAQ